MISIIVAYDKNRAIGKDNKLCWRQSNDLKRFKELTTDKTVVMGRKTFESIGKPLPNRKNIVLTRQRVEIDGVEVVSSITDIKDIKDDIFIIGGGEIYKLFLDVADRIYATEIDCKIEADTWFPEIGNNWKIIKSEKNNLDDKNQFNYNFVIYEK
jgi:dihydrofolate reductase